MFIGNKSIQKYFDRLIKSDGLSHAHLFYGPEGIGKRLLALKISESIAGPIYINSDLKIIDKGTEEIHIADIRELKNFIYLTPFGKYKIAVINNAHNLGHDASNALLKILEEPPGKSVLFLISHLPKLLLPTVISRCQKIRFNPLKESEIGDYLINDKKVKKEIANSIVKFSNGSLGLALDLAGRFDDFQKNANLLNKLIKAEFLEKFETAKKISAEADELRKIAKDWLIWASKNNSSRLTKNLLYLNNTLSKSHLNHRLALEGFLVRL